MPTEGFSRFITHSSRQLMQALGYTTKFVETSQGPFHYYFAQGSGPLPPIMVLHGFGTQGAEMYRLLQRLRRYSRMVLAPDLPMHGFTGAPRDGINLTALDQMYFEAMDKILAPLEPAVFFGNSLGGLASLRYYLYNPAKVRLMVLSSPAGARISQADFDAVQRLFAELSQQQPDDLVSRLYTKPPLYRWFVAREIKTRFARQELKDFMDHFKSEHTFSPEELAAVKVPTMVIWGKGDRILENQLDYFKQHLPSHVKFLEPRHYSHAPYLEHPLEMAHTIQGFALLHCSEVRELSRGALAPEPM